MELVFFMRISLKYSLLLLFLTVGMVMKAQTYEDENPEVISNEAPPIKGYRHFISCDILMPNVLSNAANRRAFQGFASANLDYRIKVFKGLQIGPNFRYSGYNITSTKLNDGKNKPMNSTLSFGVSIAYEISLGERFAYIPGVGIGAAWTQYRNLDIISKGAASNSASTWTDWGAFIAVNNGFYYYVKRNQRIGIGVIVTATYFSHEFKLRKTGLDLDSSIMPVEGSGVDLNKFDKGPTFALSFGFGFVTKIGEIKR